MTGDGILYGRGVTFFATCKVIDHPMLR